MNRQELIRLIRKYVRGNASVEERAFVEAYHATLQKGGPIDDILSPEEAAALEDAMFRRITAQTVPVRRLFVRYAAAAAAVVAIASTLLLVHRSPAPASSAYADIAVKRGQVLQVKLSDGSLAWINSDSHVRFLKTFGDGPREVFLEGEGYFEVARDDKHPFLVHSRDVTTHVLGTKFNVDAYAGHPVTVTLLEGKVMLTAPSAKADIPDTLMLIPSQKAFYTADRLVLEQPRPVKHSSAATSVAAGDAAMGDAAATASWKDGLLVFSHQPLSDVIEVMQRRYAITIEADSALLNEPVTATLSGLSAEEALIQVTSQIKRGKSHAQYQKSGDTYHIE
ncbi:MAG TPA: FecR domain-containing protein [Dinghuibacter sp.]|uniref:FecR family protein n=1 Tax=Dinghuibacter sp. TaxID=2024697 RepID=UPI002CB6D3B4|nr:FecR domain-containing protein [Dinghuibacter sp.]HTJ12504.1 FecR domain-containing protein [Dinghuibacter sp.]